MGWLKIARQAVRSGSVEHVDDSFLTTTQKGKIERIEDVATSQTSHESLVDSAQSKSTTEHYQITSTKQIQNTLANKRPFVNLDTAECSLPFIPSSEVSVKRNHKDAATDIWIVIDNVVYDCSAFVDSHPGGDTVIKSFCGSDCSWQFWRFHSRDHLDEFGRGLRIGKTIDVHNPFKEPSAYVGLRRLNNDADEW
jgi:cytochrome b involved in lipid metabolism